MSNIQPQKVSYGLSQALIVNAPSPIVAKRNPLTTDFMQIGTVWSNTLTNAIFILASIVNNSATWEQVSQGGAAAFTTLTVTPGPVTLTGTVNINTAGAAVTNIGSNPGAGIVNIGNAASGVDLVGDVTVANGDVVVLGGRDVEVTTAGSFQFTGGAYIVYHAGDPNGVVAALKGSLCLSNAGTGVADRAWINTDGISTWTAISTVA